LDLRIFVRAIGVSVYGTLSLSLWSYLEGDLV
jgi:hypothetical protein